MEKRIQDLENRIRQLESKGNLGSSVLFDAKVVSKNQLIAERNGIKITSTSNPIGCYILTGNATNDASIKAEYGTSITNGSLYLSSSVTQPFFVNYNGTWILVNLP